MSSAWTCPFCKRPTTVTSSDIDDGRVESNLDSDKDIVSLYVRFTVCPNTECKKLNLYAVLLSRVANGKGYLEDGDILNFWHLIPDSVAKVYSTGIVPKAIVEDYEEACKIKSLSPKASATLARRALQGMIRDFWEIKKPADHKGLWTLVHEVQAIKDKVDIDVWNAIDAVRSVGNIGAHMEKDVDIIINVEQGEAEKLIELIEMLIEEWYINSHERKLRLAGIVEMAKAKTAKKLK